MGERVASAGEATMLTIVCTFCRLRAALQGTRAWCTRRRHLQGKPPFFPPFFAFVFFERSELLIDSAAYNIYIYIRGWYPGTSPDHPEHFFLRLLSPLKRFLGYFYACISPVLPHKRLLQKIPHTRYLRTRPTAVQTGSRRSKAGDLKPNLRTVRPIISVLVC